MPAAPDSFRSGTILFYGEDIIALQQLDPNETYVPIWQICARLGIALAQQERRIRAHAVLGAGARRLPCEIENQTRPMLCLRVDLIPLWLLTIEAVHVSTQSREQLELFQRESASVLWQGFRPQGFGSEDALLPTRLKQTAAEQAYVAALAMATLARQQLLIERQLRGERSDDSQGANPWASVAAAVDDPQAARLAQTVRRVAITAAERSRRNEYGGVYAGLYRQFSISSYRKMPPARLYEALEWLERWHGDLLGEPEPPPDI